MLPVTMGYTGTCPATRGPLSCITNMDVAQSCILALHEKKRHEKRRVSDNGGVLAWETKHDKGIHLG